MPLRDETNPISNSISYPPQFPAENPDPARTQDINNRGNLGACPPKLTAGGSEGITFKFWRKHN